MTKQVQRRRGTATQHTSFTGAEGEISVNTTNKSAHVHDGVTAGGVEAARADLSNVSDANLNSALSGNTVASLTITSADINGGTIDGATIGGASAGAGTFTSVTGSGFSTASTTNPISYMDQNVGWAPTLLSTDGGETITYTVNSGQYCRYGEWVTCTGRIVVASVSGGSGSAFIGGLPFTTVNASVAQGTLQVGLASDWVGTAPQTGGTPQNTVTCALRYFNGTQTSSIGWAEVQAGTTLWFSLIYRAA
jgi:hypothetical protein